MANDEFDNQRTDKQAQIEFIVKPAVQEVVAEHGLMEVVQAISDMFRVRWTTPILWTAS